MSYEYVSDDELSKENLQWEWIYSDTTPAHADHPSKKRKASEAFNTQKHVTGARRGTFELYVGDIVRLKAERNETWVALITDFVDEDDPDDIDDDQSEAEGHGCKAVFLWFSSPKDVLNLQKRRRDHLPNEIYITAAADENLLDTIEGKATVCSVDEFKKRYPNGKIPKNSPDQGKLLVCRRGCNTKTATYTDEFVWEDIYRGAEDIQKLQDRIETETKATRRKERDEMLSKPRRRERPKYKELDDFVAADGEGEEEQEQENEPRTPKKLRHLDVPGQPITTPQSLRKKLTPNKFLTPTAKRIVAKKPLTFTPLGTRILGTPLAHQSPHQQARSHLHVGAVPTSLPCRENEFAEIYTHLESSISLGTGSCIYISGVPGTGKTATVREVIASLSDAVAAEALDDFLFCEINGMKLTDPHQAYTLLWEALSGERLAPGHALALLEREFSTPSPRRIPVVVLMDELDQLVTRSQSVMYNFFNWPGQRHARLIVLAVANTMDLPERTLSNKISSRLGLTRLTFQGYTHPQLMQIIEARLAGVPGALVEPDAVQFAARKVAQVSGDARRALDICRRAVEIAEADLLDADEDDDGVFPPTPSKHTPAKTAADDKRGKVTIPVVQRAIREATTSPLQLYLRALPLAAKLFAGALLARARRTGVADALLGDVVDEARRMVAITGGAGDREVLAGAARVAGMRAAVAELAAAGVVVVEERRGERSAKLRLLVGEDEVRMALRGDDECRGWGFDA